MERQLVTMGRLSYIMARYVTYRVQMPKEALLTLDEHELMARLGSRLRLARLRRNMSQEDLARRVSTTRKTIGILEMGSASVSLGLLLKIMTVFGYPERLSAILENDPIGEDLEAGHGRKRAGAVSGVADF
jgi:DNA-binding XRE family transcriptional regulator